MEKEILGKISTRGKDQFYLSGKEGSIWANVRSFRGKPRTRKGGNYLPGA